jgi:hypothetical protein
MWTAVLVLALGFARADWFVYEPLAKDFRVELPSKPNHSSSRSTGNAGSQTRISTVELRAAHATFTVQVTEAPRAINPRSIDDGIHRFAAARQGSVEEVTKISLDNTPGREFVMTAPGPGGEARVKSRWYATEKTLFLLSVAASPGRDLPPETDRFLTSFRFLTPRPGPPMSETKLTNNRENDAPTVVDAGDDDTEAKPKPNAKPSTAKSKGPTRISIVRMPKDAKPYPEEQLEDLGRSYARDRDAFREVGPVGSVLVGFRATYIERFGGPKVRSLQPIYRSGKNHYLGRIHGEVVGPVTTVVARPGYAVGGLVTHIGLTVDGFGMVIMKVDGDRLDMDDSYNSAWIGDRNGGGPGEVSTKGGLVVGIHGRSGSEMNGISLIGIR